MEVRKEHYIGGGWVAPQTSDEIAVLDSSTGEVIGTVPRGGSAEVEHAVAAARTAFETWPHVPIAERAAALTAIADGLAARGAELAETMSREVGTPMAVSERVQVGLAESVFRSTAEIAADYPLEMRVGTSLAGGVWSSDEERAIAVARRLRTGQVAVNGGRFNVRAPFGGYKQSGTGREVGEHGLAEYFELTSLQLPATSPRLA